MQRVRHSAEKNLETLTDTYTYTTYTHILYTSQTQQANVEYCDTHGVAETTGSGAAGCATTGVDMKRAGFAGRRGGETESAEGASDRGLVA